MSATRTFYVVQGSLQVFEFGRSKSAEPLVFADSDQGLEQFDQYLGRDPGQQSLVLLDVIEEVFATDSIPKLGARDRKVLLQRRVRRKYARTPYRLPVLISGKGLANSGRSVVYSAISNHELLDPWIAIVMRHQTPLIGIYSVPMMAPELMARLFKSYGPTLFLSQHQGDKLRQSFVDEKVVKSARLSQSPAIASEQYPHFIITEIQRGRRYLERSRLLSGTEQLDVCMIVDRNISEKIIEFGESDTPLRMHFIEPEVAAKRLRVSHASSDRLESFFVESALRHHPRHNYAVSGERRYWQMSRIRRAIISSAFTAAAICSVVAGVFFGDAWRLHRDSENIDAQLTQLSEAYRRENDTLAPIKAGSYEMKLAVDTGDYILQQRVPVPWVMQQLGSVLGDYPNMRVVALTWEAEKEQSGEAAPPRRGEAAKPIAIPPLSAVAVELTATIEPFDGDMRKAFSQIDRLADDIASRTAFSSVRATEYPLDASPRASISGEVGVGSDEQKAQFKLRLRYMIATTAAGAGETVDAEV